MCNRADMISGWIQSRKEDGQEPIPCIFSITIPQFLLEGRLEDNEYIQKVTSILEKYKIEWTSCDTLPGAFCLNRDWIQTKDIPCYIEYCGVYPVEWDIEDVVTLEQLEYEGKIIVFVDWHTKEGEYIPNH